MAAQKYRISISSFGWQIVDISTWSAPMESLVTILGTTLPVAGLGLDFSISTFPAGATGQELSKSSEATRAGLADVLLKLGNIPAEYGVMATCRDCEASVSTVTFTCCGKLPNDDFKQSSSTWASEAYDGICYISSDTTRKVYNCNDSRLRNVAISSFTISAKGCAMSGLATLINYYANSDPDLGISTTTPLALNKALLKLKTEGFNAMGEVYFAAVNTIAKSIVFNTVGSIELSSAASVTYRNMQFSSYVDPDFRSLKPNPVILKLQHTRKVAGKVRSGTHFVLAVGKCGDKYVVSDPGQLIPTLLDPNGTIVLDAATQNVIGPVTGIRRFRRVTK